MAFKRIDSPVYFIGVPETRVGGSVYADLLGITDAALPAVNYGHVDAEITLLLTAYAGDLILAAHDISDGGALVALAKMAFATREGARIGVRLEAQPLDGRSGTAAFAETCGFFAEVTDEKQFLALASAIGIPVLKAGTTTQAYDFVFGETIVRPFDALYETWSAPLRDFYASAPVAGAV